MVDVTVDIVKPWIVETKAERHGSFLEVRNVLTSIWRVSLSGKKSYLVPVRMEIVSRGLFVTYLSNVPDGDGYQPVAKCAAVEAAEECLRELMERYPDFEPDASTIARTIEGCVSERLKGKLGSFATAKVKCGAISTE